MTEYLIAVSTSGAHRVTDPRRRERIRAYKMGTTNAAAAILLALYGAKARDVSPTRAAYRYIALDGQVAVRHGYVLLALTAAELARAERIARAHPSAGAFLWRDQRWLEFPNQDTADYAEARSRSGPRFHPTGLRPVLPSTGSRDPANAGITVEKRQRSPQEKPWYWLSGNTYPHRALLKRHGARFSGKRRAWYWVGWELPQALRQLADTQEVDSTSASAPRSGGQPGLALDAAGVSPPQPGVNDGAHAAFHSTAAQDGVCNSHGVNPLDPVLDGVVGEAPAPTEGEPSPAVRVIRPAALPAEGEPLDVLQAAIQDVKTMPLSASPVVISNGSHPLPIGQAYCGELTGSITGQVFCYGYALHDGICVYVNMGGPRTGVEAIRAKLSKGEMVTVVPDGRPAVELTAGEGNTGRYADYLQTIPEARFSSLILLHDWVIHPNYSGAATTFLFRVNEAQARAQLKTHITRLVNLPVFDAWTDYLWRAGQTAMLVRPTRSAGGIDLLTISLDATAWTRLISGGIQQQVISLPNFR